jgi:hypothetical protein
MSWHRASLFFTVVCMSFAGARLIADLETSAHAASPSQTDLLCRTFKHSVNEAVVVDSSDQTSAVGQWVARERARGWEVHDIDLEIAQKSNGFSQGFVQVCLKGSR